MCPLGGEILLNKGLKAKSRKILFNILLRGALTWRHLIRFRHEYMRCIIKGIGRMTLMPAQEQPKVTEDSANPSANADIQNEKTQEVPVTQGANAVSPRAKPTPKKRTRKRSSKKPAQKPPMAATVKRTPRPYPAASFEEALPLAEAIHKYASGEKVRRLTLLKQLDKSPTSSATRMLITSSGRYGLTTGGYDAEWLDLTEIGSVASNPDSSPREKLEASFKLAVENIAPFQRLYNEYKAKRLPTHDVLKDVLSAAKFEIDNPSECVDLFIVNAKYLGLLQTIAGSETLISIEQTLDELGDRKSSIESGDNGTHVPYVPHVGDVQISASRSSGPKVDWDRTCFVITPIGEEGSETRQHADLFLGQLIEPALREFQLEVIRADKIGAAGMITTQILEYVMRSRLAIVDLSHHNPNAFYEMAIRHACKLPVVQISRKADRLPFDVNQVRTVVIDTTDIYSLVPKLETYKSEIATQVRAALSDSHEASNPISVFFPGFQVTIPKEK
jgi:hypothetical protein